jgi:hypothetical protein
MAAILQANPNIEALSSSQRGRYSASRELMVRLETARAETIGTGSSNCFVNAIPGIRAYLQNPPSYAWEAREEEPYQCTLEYQYRTSTGRDGRKENAERAGAAGHRDGPAEFGHQAIVDIDRDSASRRGITADDIENVLDAYGARQVSTIYTPRTILGDPRAAAEYQLNPPRRLALCRVEPGKMVPLNRSAVAWGWAR